MKYLQILDSRGRQIRASATEDEAAGTGRRLSTWGMSTAGPNRLLGGSLSALRSRSRELIRNDPQINGGLDTLVSNIIGMGISPRWQLDNSKLKAALQELWADWVPEADADGLLDLYGLQALAARAIIESGEVFFRFRPRWLKDGLSVPLQLQILEADHLDESYNVIAPNGNEVRMGIEFDALGRRTAYWFYRQHPGETFITFLNQFERVRVPASEVMHVFKPLRPGMQRGKPWLAATIVTMHELNQFNDAELVRKKTAAMFGGFVTQPPEEDADMPNILGTRTAPDEDGADVIDFQPGTFPTLPAGFDVKFSSPADVGGNYEQFVKHQERRAARGMAGLTYEKFTGDLTGVNYSSIRAGNLEFQRQCKQFIYNVLVFQMCRPIARYWTNQAFLSNSIKLPGYLSTPNKYWRIKWTIDGWPWVDPEKDLNASKGLIRNGLSSRAQEVAERGLDVETLESEIATDNARADAAKLVFDSDPRNTDGSGRNYAAEAAAKPVSGSGAAPQRGTDGGSGKGT